MNTKPRRKKHGAIPEDQFKPNYIARSGEQLEFDAWFGWNTEPAQHVGAQPFFPTSYLDGYHSLMEAAKALNTVATEQHPGENHHYYSTLLNLMYKELFGASKGKNRGLRQRLTVRQLQKLARVEQEVAGWVFDILASGDDYHQVYYQVQQLQQRVSELGREVLTPPVHAPVQQTLW